MQWVPIDKEDLPRGEVLAACFNPESSWYRCKGIDEVTLSEYGVCQCGLEDVIVDNVTHYIDIDKYDIGERPVPTPMPKSLVKLEPMMVQSVGSGCLVFVVAGIGILLAIGRFL